MPCGATGLGRAQVVAAPLGSRCCSAKASRTNRYQCRSDLNASPVNVAAARFVFSPPAGRRRWRGVFLPRTSSPSARHAQGEEGTCPLSSVCLCPRGLSAGRCFRARGVGVEEAATSHTGRRPPSRSGLLPPQDLSRRLPVAPAPGRASFAYRVQTGHRFWDISTTKPTKASVPGSTLHLLGAP